MKSTGRKQREKVTRLNLTERQFNNLQELLVRYERETRACARARAYYAGCIMLGATLEGSLLAMCHMFQDETRAAISALPKEKQPNGRLLRWDLNHLIPIARGAAWLPAREKGRGPHKIGDWVEMLRDLRNLVHLGRHVREYPKVRLRAAVFHNAREVFETANDWILDRLYKDIRKRMEAEEKRAKKARAR
jgi:hypothetical protein